MPRPSAPCAAAAALLVLSAALPPRAGAQDPPPAPAGNGAAPPARGAAPAGSGAEPAGMVRFPGGKVRIGMSRKALEELIKKTELGRMSHQERPIEDGYSVSCPEFEVELPPFWIGKYEVTNAQWHRFLQSPGVKLEYEVPAKGAPGPATLELIARQYLLAEPFQKAGGGTHYPVANDWRTLYDLNEAVINPVLKDQDPKARPAPETFRERPLPPGTKLRVYRWSVPLTWRARAGAPVQDSPPPGMEEMPANTVSYADASAFAEYYGCHLPTETEWEAACRGPKGELWPEGGDSMDPLAHAWKGFNPELGKAQEAARKQIDAARKRVADARSPAAADDAQATLARLEWILAARELPEDPPFTVVGKFPYGKSPCGAMDMIGNVEEWVSTTLYRYPNSDTKSKWADADAHILRGGNTIYRDSLLTATFRSFLFGEFPLMEHMKFATAGFRVARYETPGASAASHIVNALRDAVPPVLPREEEKGTRKLVGPDVAPYRAVGIERYEEVPWTSASSPAADPPGKVFLLGAAQSLCVLPATGIPFSDPGAIREAAIKEAVPVAGPDGALKADRRRPRDIPFLGVLHFTRGVEVKGSKRVEKWVDVPLTEKERADLLAAWKEAQKKKAEREKAGESPPKDGGGDGGAKDGGAPGNRMAGPEGKTGGKGGAKGGAKGGSKGGAKGGDKPAEGAPPPAGDKPPEGDQPEEEAPEPDENEPKIPTTKKQKAVVQEEGFLSGADYEGGLLLGFVKVLDEPRVALWEPRTGAVGSTAPGGTVLLEHPLLVLPKDSVDFKKVGKPGVPVSTLDGTTGEAKLVFYVPVESRSSTACIEVTLRLKIDFASGWTGGPWVTQPPR